MQGLNWGHPRCEISQNAAAASADRNYLLHALTHKRSRVTFEIVVWVFGIFDNNLEIKNAFRNNLKESF